MGGAKNKLLLGGCGLFVALSGCVENSEDSATTTTVEQAVYSQSGHAFFARGNLGQSALGMAERVSGHVAELSLVEDKADSLGFVHARYEQEYQGLRVFGGDIRVALNPAGQVKAAYGATLDSELPTDASVSQKQAEASAMSLTEGAEEVVDAELAYIVPSSGDEPALAWRFEVIGKNQGMPIRDNVFISAVQDTEVLVDRHPQIHSAKNRSTYDARNGKQLVRSEGDAAYGNVEIDQAHDAAGLTYDCLQDLFGRDSYDDRGAQLKSVARINDQNAYWDGDSMYYGYGFAVADVGTHEFGHAVTERTANLVYQNEPGALNEGASDILASICDAYKNGGVVDSTFIIGETIDIGTGGFTRDLADPAASQSDSRDFYADRYRGNQDNGGVHINSGILNLAFVMLTQGGQHPRNKSDVEVVGVGLDDASQIFYRALTKYMGQNTNFAQGRAAFEQAAADLHGEESSQVFSVREAFASVGVGEAPTGERPAPVTEPTDPAPEPTDPVDDGRNAEEPLGQPGAPVTAGCSSADSNGAPLWFFWLLAFVVLRRSSERSRASFAKSDIEG